jgi:nitric oxide reductase subunit C
MTKRQGRLFFIVCTVLFSVVFIALTLDSHRQFGKLTNADKITPEVIAGKHVWHKNNCINCHTLMGEGSYYAPDLTKITAQRGAPYLEAFLKDPSRFYSEQKHRRLMPNPKLSDREIAEVIAFLEWVSHIDNQGWPPRPILVTGASIPGTDVSKPSQAAPTSADPVARGEALFRSTPPGCFACHSVAAGVNLAGPSLAGVGSRATQIVSSPDYHGSSKDAAGYIRESLVKPSAYVVPGAMYSANGQSFMPGNYGTELSAEQIDSLVAYLQTLK